MRSAILVLAAVLCGAPHGAVAADSAAGALKARQCAVCHGPKGWSDQPMFPHLAGQKEEYLVAALKAYRDGSRRNENMNVVAKTLSDKDIADLAAYYAGIEVELAE